MALLRSLLKRVNAKLTGQTPGRFELHDTGFHGDEYLIDMVDILLKQASSFIETGTNVGTTLRYVAQTYPYVNCLSCEPDPQAFAQAVRNTASLPNVRVYNEDSTTFIERLDKEYSQLYTEECMFWLDAHGYGFDWPLREEVRFITSRFTAGFILIDDFKVPGLDVFKYDTYQGQICSFDYIEDSISFQVNYDLYYPNYTEKISQHHALTGWGLISFGHAQEIDLDEKLGRKVKLAKQKRL